MRVLLVTEASAKGTGRHVLDLAEGLIGHGCEVHLLYSPVRTDASFLARLEGIRELRHAPLMMRRSIHPSDLLAAWRARGYMRRHGPFHIIHGHSSKGGAVARLAAMGAGAAVIYTPHALVTLDPDLSSWARLFYRGVEVGLSWLTTRIIAVSPEEARAGVELGLGAPRVRMVPNGVRREMLAPRDEARRRFGVNDGEVVIGSVGRLVSNKAPEVLVRSVALAARTVPNLRLLFIGDGPNHTALRALATRLGVGENVMLPGELDAREALLAFDLYATASRKEGMPYAVLEAMAAGLPVVATATAGVEALVEPGVNGAVVAMDDVEALAAALVKLATQPDLMARQGAASLERVARFTPERMVEQTLGIYRDCVEGRGDELDSEGSALAGEPG